MTNRKNKKSVSSRKNQPGVEVRAECNGFVFYTPYNDVWQQSLRKWLGKTRPGTKINLYIIDNCLVIDRARITL